MSKKLNETIGTVAYDGLIVSNVPVADVVTVTLSAAAKVLKRGTVVVGTAGGALAPASAALAAGKAIYILADDVEAGATKATAYRTGHFARNKLITDGTYAITAADEEIMRAAGILLSDAIEV